MTTARAGVFGLPPKLLIKPANPEKSKYLKLWTNPAYRECAPGEQFAQTFMAQARPTPKDTVIDFGCGTGRGALMLAILGGGLKVHMLDFAENCLDEELQQALETQKHVLSFQVADLEKPILATAKYGYCTDVMEHIPTEKVEKVLSNILRSAQYVFFSIAMFDDSFGATIGEKLHLTVKPYSWWVERFQAVGAVIHWGKEEHINGNPNLGYAQFYVSNWTTTKELVAVGKVNTTNEVLLEHVKAAVARRLPQVKPHDRQTTEVMILGGGPSLADYWDEIKEKRLSGTPLVTLNGTYNEAIARGIVPSAQVVVDAREFNSRFVTPHVPTCKYLLASQCHPAVFDAAPAAQTMVWHAAMSEDIVGFLNEWSAANNDPWFPIIGGSTVMLRVFHLLRILGFSRFTVYGFDSCLREDAHHAYAQPENDNDKIISVICGERIFKCYPWMASQAHEFMDLTRAIGDEYELDIKGDGLIAHILATGAALEDADSVTSEA